MTEESLLEQRLRIEAAVHFAKEGTAEHRHYFQELRAISHHEFSLFPSISIEGKRVKVQLYGVFSGVPCRWQQSWKPALLLQRQLSHCIDLFRNTSTTLIKYDRLLGDTIAVSNLDASLGVKAGKNSVDPPSLREEWALWRAKEPVYAAALESLQGQMLLCDILKQYWTRDEAEYITQNCVPSFATSPALRIALLAQPDRVAHCVKGVLDYSTVRKLTTLHLVTRIQEVPLYANELRVRLI